MSRSWPFEDKEEPQERLRHPVDFLERRGRDGTEAVVVGIGLNDAQLVLIDGRGWWDRWVYHSVDEAKEIADALGVPVFVGEYPEETRVRMNAYRKPAAAYDLSPYPEQGSVGPVIPYRENRPRPPKPLPEEAPPARD